MVSYWKRKRGKTRIELWSQRRYRIVLGEGKVRGELESMKRWREREVLKKMKEKKK